MRTKTFSAKRLLSLLLTVAMFATMILPAGVFAVEESALQIDGLEGLDILVGRAVEFTVTSVASTEDVGKTVICHYEIDAEETDIEKLEYYETTVGMEGWYEFSSKISGSFGPATGFPYFDGATSKFRVTFAKAGTYSVTVSADLLDGTGKVSSETFDVEVREPVAAVVTTDIEEKEFVVDNTVDFGVTTTPNDEAGMSVLGKFEIEADEDDLSALQYLAYPQMVYMDLPYTADGGKLVGYFGPTTGFPLTEATSSFKATFANNGIYDVTISIVESSTLEPIASTNASVKVLAYADYTDLNAAIATAQDCVDNEGKYTTATIADVKTALDAAKDVVDAKYTEKDQAVVNSANDELKAALDALLLLADTADIKALIATATTKVETDYTKATWTPFKNALDDANELLENELSENDQTDVDDAETALESAMNALKEVADTDALKAKVDEADVLDENIYSTVTFGAMKEKLEAAKTLLIEDLSYVDDQTRVNSALAELTTAVDNLKKLVAVSVSATAVASDVTAEYGKADAIVLVFGAALGCNAGDVVDAISIKTDVASAEWVDTNNKTVLKLTLADNNTLTNGAIIAFEESEAVVDTNGNVVSETAVTVIGNLDEAYENVTATSMTATFVNVDDKPYIVDGDEIVLVFNAPVYDDGSIATITVSGLEFNVVTGTSNTIYKRVLDADDAVALGQMLTYENANPEGLTISAPLKGTFGGTVVPVVVRALVEDVDGTAKTAGDKINLFFNVPTNKVAGEVETNFTGVLAGSTGLWIDSQTLVITLGNTAIKITDRIVLSELGIKDFYGTTDVDVNGENNLGYALEGSFGVAVQPALLTLTAISKQGKGAPSAGDEIYLAFNVKMDESVVLNKSDFTFSYGDYGTGATVAWATGEEYKEYSTIIITLGENANVVPGTTKITINENLKLYEESGTKYCESDLLENRVVTGTFGTSIAPNLINASIVKRKTEVGSQPGDQIVLLFNVPTNHADIINLISVSNGNLGNNVEEGLWSNNNTIYTITLGDGAYIENDSTITFTNTNGVLKDINGQKSAATKTIDLIGSFGTEADEVGISPTSVTATIVKTTAVAGAQEEDQIVFAFNVATNGVDLVPYFKDLDIFGDEPKGVWSNGNTIYTLILGNGATVTDGTKISFTEDAGIKDANGINDAVKLNNISLVGSFGKEVKPVTVAPTLLDAVIIKGSNTVGATKGDKIQFIFNMAINDADLYKELGGVNVFGAESNGAKDNNIYTITIGNNANIPASFNITAAAGLKDAAEFSEAALIPNIVLTGSFGNEIKPVTAAPTLFKAVIVKATDTVGPQAGDKIQLVFNMAINGADLFATLGGEAVFGSGSYGSADSNVYTITLGTGITSIPTTFSINSDAGLKDASGYSANAVIPNFTLVGSFGIVVNPVATKPALKNAVIIKDSGMLGIHAGDKIVLIFNVATNGKDDNINLLNNIDFPGRNDETLGLNPTGRWISDIEYEITLGEGAAISEVVNNNAIIKFNHHNALMDKAKITAASEIEVYKFEGSFGVAPELTLEKAIIVKGANNTVAKAQKGDMIILSFSSKTNAADIKAKLGSEYGTANVLGVWSNDDTVYTITLGDNPTIADAANFSIPENTGLTGIDGGVFASNAVPFEGSFGKVNTPSVISAVAYSDVDNDYIDITFNIDTDPYIEDQEQGKYIFASSTIASGVLGDYSINWSKGPNVLTIILGNNHNFEKNSEITFANGLIMDADRLGKLADGTKVSGVKGELRKPYVTSVVANYDEGTGVETLTVTFSSKTNKPENIDLSAQYSSLGRGATATWTDTKTLVITLGAGRTISVNGTGGIILNGLGITNGFDTNEVVGQYSITDGTLKEYDLKVDDARVNRKTNDSGVKEDILTVTFNSSTNMYGKVLNTPFNVSEIETNIVATKTFGTGATAKWESASKLVITLGEGHTFKNENDTNLASDSKVTFKNLAFANGLGSVVEDVVNVKGSFDGREVKLNNLTVATANEYTTATVKLDKQVLECTKDAIVTFVIWDAAKTTVTDMNAVKLNMAAVDTIEVSSKFAAKDYSKVEVYVTDEYINDIDENTTFGVLAETVTANKAQ